MGKKLVRIGKAIYDFKQLDICSKLYVILFVAIMFCGNTFLIKYVSHMMIIQLILLFFMAFVKGVQNNAYLNKKHLLLWFLISLFYVFLLWQTTISYDPSITLVYFKRYLIYSFFLLLVAKPDIAFCSIKFAKYYSLVVGISIIIMAIVTGQKVGGLVGSYHYAGMLMSIACILFVLDYYQNNTDNFHNAIGIGISLACIFISGKRIFTVLAILSLILIFLLTHKNKKIQKFCKISLLLGFSMFPLYFLFRPIREVFNRFIGLYASNDLFILTSGRNFLWEMAIDIFNNHSLSGIGFASFPQYTFINYDIPEYGVFYTHNIYLGLLAETGIIGFSLMISIFIFGFINTIKVFLLVRKQKIQFLEYIILYSVAMQVWFILYGFTGNGIYDVNVFYFYISSIAMMLSVRISIYRNNDLTAILWTHRTCDKIKSRRCPI